MTRQDFERLKQDYDEGTKNFKDYLVDNNIPVQQYYYWRRRFSKDQIESSNEFVNITSKINQNISISDVELTYPNGIRVCFRIYPRSKAILDLIQL